MRFFVFFYGFVLAYVCYIQQKDQDDNFVDLRRKLPTIKAPIELPGYLRKISNINLPNNAIITRLRQDFEKKQLSFTLIGKLFESNNYIAILGQASTQPGTPIILVYNNQGKQTDSLEVYHPVPQSVTDSTSVLRTFHYGLISAGKQLQVVDSTIHINLRMENGAPVEIPATQTYILQNRNYKFTDSGKIEMVK